MCWVGERSISVIVVGGAIGGLCGGLVVEDDDFVDAKYGERPGKCASEVGLLIVRFGVGDDAAGEGD